MNEDMSHESRRLVKAMLVQAPAGHLLKGLGTKLGIRCSSLACQTFRIAKNRLGTRLKML